MQPEFESSEREISEQTDSGFIGFLERSPHDGLSDLLVSRVIPSILRSMRIHGFYDFTEESLKYWVADMILDRLKGSTVKRYLGSLHTLYRNWHDNNNNESEEIDFSISQDIFKSNNGKRLSEIEDNLKASEKLAKISIKQDSPSYVYNRAFLYLLFNPSASFNDILTLKFSDNIPSCPHLEDIVTSLRNVPQAKYVFQLQQGKRRDGAIIKDLISELHATARRAGIKSGDRFSRESITSIWIAAAIKEGIPLSEIKAMVPVMPDDYFFLSIVPVSEISDSRKVEIMNTVAYALTNKTPGWFVLRMRNGVTPEKIKERLKEKESPLQRQIKYYYPLRVIKKLEKKKVVTVETPVIPGVLFFRLPNDRVTSLMSIIGDMAWCYRTTANPSSPYSVIPQKEMKIFQKSVGAFTVDVEMDIISELPSLQVGDKVIIEDGSSLDGQTATIRKVQNMDGTITYTLRLSDSEFIRWKDIRLPGSHLAKAD